MKLLTCRRHPKAGRFLATCSGCAQERFDTEQRNRLQAAARKALATINTPTDARIISIERVGEALLVVTEQPTTAFPYAVDTFRPATTDETDREQDDPRPVGSMVLIDQLGGYDDAAVPDMRGKALAYLTELGFTSTRRAA